MTPARKGADRYCGHSAGASERIPSVLDRGIGEPALAQIDEVVRMEAHRRPCLFRPSSASAIKLTPFMRSALPPPASG